MGKLLSFLLRGAFHLHKYDVIGRASSSDESCTFCSHAGVNDARAWSSAETCVQEADFLHRDSYDY